MGDKFGKTAEAVQIIYSPFSGCAQLMTSELLPELGRVLSGGEGSAEMKAAVAALHDLSSRKKMIPIQDYSFSKLRSLVIIPTFACNFHCSYCYAAQGKENAFLTEERLKSGLDYFLDPKRFNGKKMLITFLGGGEPLMAEELIKSGCMHAMKLVEKSGIPLQFDLVTNGSLITQKTAELLKEFNIHVSVSFEILEDIQNEQRGNYAAVADGIRTLIRNGISPTIRAIITPRGLRRQKEMIEELLRQFPEIKSVNFEFATQPDLYKSAEQLQEDLSLFCSHFRQARLAAEAAEVRLSNSMFDAVHCCQERFCQGEFVLTPHGDITCCHRITHRNEKEFDLFCYGGMDENGNVDIIEEKADKLLAWNGLESHECQICPARWNCAGYCMIKRRSYTPEVFKALCETMRKIQKETLFDQICLQMEKMGIDVYDLFK